MTTEQRLEALLGKELTLSTGQQDLLDKWEAAADALNDLNEAFQNYNVPAQVDVSNLDNFFQQTSDNEKSFQVKEQVFFNHTYKVAETEALTGED